MHQGKLRTLCLAAAAAGLITLAGCGGSGSSTTTTTTTASTLFYAHNAVFSNHTTWAWGANESGQLGNGGTSSSLVPVMVGGFANYSGVAIGASHTVAFQKYSTVRAWGYNGFGQLGNGLTVNSNRPVKVGTTLSGVVAVAAGGYHSLALGRDGAVFAWGSNSVGQLGNSAAVVGLFSSLPVLVPLDPINGIFSGVTAIAAGGSHSLALTSDGTVCAWGNNQNGQLGSTRTDWSVPKPVPGIIGTVVKIAAGGSHSLALTSGGTIWAWGYNYFGQLGNGTVSDSSTPVAITIPGLDASALIAAGLDHSLAYDSVADTLWVWGYNAYGQLGDGTTISRSTPVAIPAFTLKLTGGTLPQAIFAVGHHSHARKTNGKWFSWGNNTSGQLGIGTSVNSLSPLQVSGL